MSQTPSLIEVKELKKHFRVKPKGTLYAVDGVSFEVEAGETLGLVGESGCGKSTVGNLLVNLLSKTDGQVYFKGQDVDALSKQEQFDLKQKIQIIFQDPFSSLNPQKTIRQILSEPYKIHNIYNNQEEMDKAIDALAKMVGLEEYVLSRFPHELDGGRRQLVGIARALALNPEFIVCDEPVSSLDVSIQANIINLLMRLQKELNLSYLFISHDLSVVRHISDKIAVMYLGQVMELTDADTMFSKTTHPYSIALLSAVPQIDSAEAEDRIVLEGDVPNPIDPEPGCRFASRCWLAQDICRKETPELLEVEDNHCVRCHFRDEIHQKVLKGEDIYHGRNH